MATDARTAILSRICKANGRAGVLPSADEGWNQIERRYRQTSSLSSGESVKLLEDRLTDYGAQVVRCEQQDLPTRISEILSHRGVRRLLAPIGFPENSLPNDVDLVADTGLSGTDLDGFDAAVTECTVAIAETGTLVLLGVAGQGRRAMSLVPDVHLCVLRTKDVVTTVPEAWARLAPFASLPMTLVSGPSATSDIEMTRIQGVHGPRSLYVLLLD